MTYKNAIHAYKNYVESGQTKLAEIQKAHILKKYKIDKPEESDENVKPQKKEE